MRRAAIAIILSSALAIASAATAAARPVWKAKIDRLVSGRAVGVAVSHDGDFIYRRKARARRTPASNQKLLASMALLDTLGPHHRATTTARGTVVGGVVSGDLWIVGRGDPTLSHGKDYPRSLSVEATSLRRLALRIARAGVTRVAGRVMGSRTYFAHDWDAPGWKPDFPDRYIALPSALSINGNTHSGRHIDRPERRLARLFTRRLEGAGVDVEGAPGDGSVPAGLPVVASVTSAPLSALLLQVNRRSSNFFAEVLGKRLGVASRGVPGTIAKGAAAIEQWTAAKGVVVEAFDSSGLSYRNEVTTQGLVRLLDLAADETWGWVLRRSLPKGGWGTLGGRLEDTRMRAKTGTLSSISALSGWVWLRRHGSWAEFSILSKGMSKNRAASVEDRIVRILHRRAR